MRSALAIVGSIGAVTTGCALVSGLSNLDVAMDSTLDGSAAFDVSTDKSTDAPITGDSGNLDVSPIPLDAPVGEAGPACSFTSPNAPSFTSKCVLSAPAFQAAAVSGGTYFLYQIDDVSPTCGGYKSESLSGVLDVAKSGTSFILQERIKVGTIETARGYTATVSGTTMTVTLTCGPGISSNQWQVQAGSFNLDVLKGNRIYHWTND